MSFSTWLRLVRGELRVLGWLVFAIPVVLVVGLTALTGLFFIGNVPHSFIGSFLLAAIEACLPLATSLVIATLVAQDSALELQLTLPLAYYRTVFRRLGLLLAWTMLVDFLATVALQFILPWAMPEPFPTFQLVWLSPTLWLSALGIICSLLFHNRTTTSAILGCLWVVQLAMHGFFAAYDWTRPWFVFATLYNATASFWFSNRLELLVMALVMFGLTWWYLHHPEWRFRGEE